MYNATYISNTPEPLELIRIPILSSVLLSMLRGKAVHMVLESVRMSVYYL